MNLFEIEACSPNFISNIRRCAEGDIRIQMKGNLVGFIKSILILSYNQHLRGRERKKSVLWGLKSVQQPFYSTSFLPSESLPSIVNICLRKLFKNQNFHNFCKTTLQMSEVNSKKHLNEMHFIDS